MVLTCLWQMMVLLTKTEPKRGQQGRLERGRVHGERAELEMRAAGLLRGGGRWFELPPGVGKISQEERRGDKMRSGARPKLQGK